VAGVVADRPIELVDVIPVLGEAAAVEHIETRCVGTGYRVAVEIGVGPVLRVGGVERLERGGIGRYFERLSR
jgi:hypothetical protein